MKDDNIYTVTIKIAKGGTEHKEGGKTSESTAGHMWYTLSENGKQTESFGFGPEAYGITSLFGMYTDGRVLTKDDESYQSTYATFEVRITKEQYDKLKEFGEEDNLKSNNFNPHYKVATNSCVDYVWKAMEFAGVNPDKFDGDMFPKNNRDDVNAHLYKALHGTSIPKEEQRLEKRASDGSFTAIYGSKGVDLLTSTKEAEVLYGGKGDDALNGIAGHADRLRGGKDFDTYSVQENDAIKDSDGKGQIYFNASLLSGIKHRVSEDVYEDAMFTYTQEKNNLIIAQKADPSKSITIEAWDRHKKMLEIELCDDVAQEELDFTLPMTGVSILSSEAAVTNEQIALFQGTKEQSATQETTDYTQYLPEHLRPVQTADENIQER